MGRRRERVPPASSNAARNRMKAARPRAAVEPFSYRSAPEPGQLVEVRRRQWVVSDVLTSQPGESGVPSQNLVTLSSIDEDGLGEDLEVIWEIEPGAHIIEKAGLPSITGQDDTGVLEAFLDAVRWGAATNADRGFLQAPFRSGASIEDFQLDPLVRAIDRARVNLLIADDVGLGKTIEAGLVIQELLLRHRARTVFVVCPASLQEKWRVEMLEKFGLEFRIVDTAYVKQLRRDRGIHANPWTSFPRLIASMDWMKSGEGLRLLRDVIPVLPTHPRKFDILVVDEAHNVAPAGSGRYALESQRTRLIRKLSPHFQHRLFLTATPHNGYTESFTSLLELLDDQRFSKNILPDDKQLAQVMVRRLKTDLVDSDGKPLYPRRKLHALSIPYSPEERAIHRTLNDYTASRERTCEGYGAAGTRFVNGLLKKRLFSSPAAFASTLEKHYATLTQAATRDRPAEKPNPMAERILRKAILKADEDYADDSQVELAQQEATQEASRRSPPLTDEEHRLLNEMRDWAQRERNRADSKAEAVVAWIDANLKTADRWNERRVILFTEYRTTHQWLHQILATRGHARRLAMIHGGMDQDEREKVKAAFQTHPRDAEVRILLATDAASEGIDLQNYCDSLIHLEIPYNPNVMEQRNGRIDRHGQKQPEVQIWHPVDGGDADDDSRRGARSDTLTETGDGPAHGRMGGQVGGRVGGHGDDILRALRKLEAMREDMGSVNPVIAPQMAGLIEGRRRGLDIRLAEERAAKTRRFVRADRQLKERIAKLHQRLLETRRDFHLSPDRIRQAAEVGLALAKKPPLRPLDWPDAPSGSVFRMPDLAGSWGRCMEGLRHPHTGRARPITFDHQVAKGRDDLVLVHLEHRLVQMCLRLMRAEVWARDDVKNLHRVDVRSLPAGDLAEPLVVVISRLLITGADHQRLHEELTQAGGYLKEHGYAREAGVGRISDRLQRATPLRASETLIADLAARFEANQDAISATVEARSRERTKYLRNTLETRKDKEIADISSVLDELQRSIKQELRPSQQPIQLELFSADERTQVRRDNDALKARLRNIPEERRREIDHIEQRYAEFTDRTFPVAVIFLVRESQ